MRSFTRESSKISENIPKVEIPGIRNFGDLELILVDFGVDFDQNSFCL